MTNDNDLLLLASSQNNKTFEVYIDSTGKKTLTPQTSNYTAIYSQPYVCYHSSSNSLLADKNPKKVVFPNCSEATGYAMSGAFEFAFMECTSLTSVSFPSLTTATGYSDSDYGPYGHGAFESAFKGCTSLTSVSFPSLTTATGGGAFGAFQWAVRECTSLTSISFPALTTVYSFTGRKATFRNAFYNCSPSLKVHFKKSMKGKTELDYNIMGLTSADQVVFDLP